MYIIQNENNENLFWHNENGWVDFNSAETFKSKEGTLPMEGVMCLRKDILEDYEKRYRSYLDDVSDDEDFDIKHVEDFDTWVEVESWDENEIMKGK